MTTDKTGAEDHGHRGTQGVHHCRRGQAVGHPIMRTAATSVSFYHTVIDPEFGGRGLATILVENALNGARDEGKRIVPVCSMVETVLKKHPEFDEINGPRHRRDRGWVQAQPADPRTSFGRRLTSTPVIDECVAFAGVIGQLFLNQYHGAGPRIRRDMAYPRGMACSGGHGGR